MAIKKYVKCPDLHDILQQRESMLPEEFDALEHIQVGLNELINKVRLALNGKDEKFVSQLYYDEGSYGHRGYSYDEILIIKRILRSKHFRVSYNHGQGMGGCTAHILRIRIPRRKN